MVFSGLAFVLAFMFLPETYSPTLLKWKAAQLRNVTSDDRYAAPIELDNDFLPKLAKGLILPVTFFTTEPIIIFLGLYLVVIYVINFTFLSGFNFIFIETYGLSPGTTSLAFAGITIGALVSTALTPLFLLWQKRLVRQRREAQKDDSSSDHDDDDPRRNTGPPELRLLPALFAAPCLVGSLLWLGWSNYASVSYWSGYGATVLFGYALTAIFVCSYQYIIDAYETSSSTALGSITMVRYLASGGMVVVSRPMYENLGVHWTLTVLGGIAVVMVPVPFVLWRLGEGIRGRSKFAR